MAELKIWKYNCQPLAMRDEAKEAAKRNLKREVAQAVGNDLLRYLGDEVKQYEDKEAELIHCKVDSFTFLNGEQTQRLKRMLDELAWKHSSVAASDLRSLIFKEVPAHFKFQPEGKEDK